MFWKPKFTMSLSLRLSLWYAGLSFLLLMLGWGWTHYQLVKAYDAVEIDFLHRKAVTLRELSIQRDIPKLNWEIAGSYVDGQVRPRAENMTLSRVIAPGGNVLIETEGMSKQLPVQSFPPEGLTDKVYGGRLYRMLSLNTPIGYRIQVARDYSWLTADIASYQRKLWAAFGIGLLLSTCCGVVIARRGLRPVQQIAAAVERISSSTLGDRLETTGLPPELASLASTFNKTLDRLEDAFSRMDGFSSDIAHELRTPVAALRNEAEVALSKARSLTEYREAVESSLEGYIHISTIIDRLLFLARAENPNTEISRELVDIGNELEVIREFYEPIAGEAGIHLDFAAPPALTVLVDRTLLQRALSNLIENSLTYTNAGGHIRVEANCDKGALIISVTDDGCGIPAEHLPRVFDRFHRVDAARTQRNGNMGLGLAIVKSVASLHGGYADISSNVGEGTRVTVRLLTA
jgi:two-component system heavy metal sensor histidine kinase CusS